LRRPNRRPNRAARLTQQAIQRPNAVDPTGIIAAKDETIARLDADVAYLREQLEHRAQEAEQLRRDQAAERERFDVIHREALQRIEALTAGEVRPEAERNSDGTPDGPSDAPGREEASQGLDSRDHPQSIVAGWLRQLFGRS